MIEVRVDAKDMDEICWAGYKYITNLYLTVYIGRSRDSVFGIATDYGLDGRGVGSSSSDRGKNFLHVVHTGSRAHPTSYPTCTGGYFPGSKAAGA
jgi:hypothetical protein